MEITILFYIVLLIYCFVSCRVAMSSTNISTDKSALLALRSRVVPFDPRGILAKNWTTDTSVCKWIGVSCNNSPDKRVTKLNLSRMALQGSVPPDIGNLSFLVSLDLSGNKFDGNLPQEIGSLADLRVLFLRDNRFGGETPAAFFNVSSKLEVLSLSHNLLQGKIPNEIGNLQKLKFLDMSNNQFGGMIPNAVFNISTLLVLALYNNSLTRSLLPVDLCQRLPKLEQMFLGPNQFSGQKFSSISWGQCSQLRNLVLAGNKLTGEIPREIGNLTKLANLFLTGNLLSGAIPREIGNLTLLQQLIMGDNMLRGAIPAEVGYLQNLYRLALYNNSLSGSIPPSVFNISNLQRISLAINSLSWSLPAVDYSRLNLEEIYLGTNNLSGVIPHAISNLSKVTTLHLEYNQFSGPIPSSLAFLGSLQELDLAVNNFLTPKMGLFATFVKMRKLVFLDISVNPTGGTIPSTIRNLSSLQYFGAFYCGLEGTIPAEIGNLSSLYFLDLGGNALRGYIPTSLKELGKIQELYIDQNEIRGIIPTFVCHLKSLGFLDLSHNKLSDPLPDCWGNLTNYLRYLCLGFNNFASNLPASIGNLKDLLELNLSSNHLIGSIPFEIGSLKAATILDLSMNKLSGDIPSIVGGLQQLIQFSLAGNKLQGHIPESLGNLVSLEFLDLSHNSLDGAVPMSLESLRYLEYFNVSFNRLSGPVPEKGSFANFTYESFMSNEALCGGAQVLKLPPCNDYFPHKGKTKKLLWLVLPIALLILSLVIVYFLVFIRRSRKNVIPSEKETIFVRTRPRISYDELHRATNGFCEENLLGMGSYGSVYKGVFLDGITMAIKVFNLQLDGAFKSFDTECEALCNLQHRNLVKVISCCSMPDFKALILKYMSNGSLDRCLHSCDHFLDVFQRLDIMIDVASALEYLHHGYSTPIIHCDVKPSNILLDANMVACLSDFGLAKLLNEGDGIIVHTNTLATIGYAAPEYGSNGILSTSCDVYSFGVLLMETFTRKRPTDDMFSGDFSIKDWIAMAVQSSTRHIMDKDLSRPGDDVRVTAQVLPCLTAIMELALKCSAELPEERINIKDALVSLKKIKVLFLGKLH